MATKESRAAANLKYYKANREKIREQKRKYFKANRERILAKQRDARAARRAYRLYYQDNRERIKARALSGSKAPLWMKLAISARARCWAGSTWVEGVR